MTTYVTYDMQKLNEAVHVLAVGDDPLKERLCHAIIPLLTLHGGGGMHNMKRADALANICDRLTGGNLDKLSADEMRKLASDIVDLENGNWHDAVWGLEDRLSEHR
jgi:hypothetical protein